MNTNDSNEMVIRFPYHGIIQEKGMTSSQQQVFSPQNSNFLMLFPKE